MIIADIIQAIEVVAPPALQESYDNAGIQVGNLADTCIGVLLCLDVTPATVEEAIARHCNLIISHHPILFKGIKKLTGATPQQRAIINAIKHGITIYAAHTNLDSASRGVNMTLAEMLKLRDVTVLENTGVKMLKLSVMIPDSHVNNVRNALSAAGAGIIGNYSDCSFAAKGIGSFRALDGANPFVGKIDELHFEPETRLDMILPSWNRAKVENALLKAHPYEVPAYEFIALENPLPEGLGAVGNIDTPISAAQLVDIIKDKFNTPVVRCTTLPSIPIKRIALCSGSGASLINNAIGSGAQAYITSDVHYHDFLDHSDDIFIVDIGHFESEICTKQIFYHIVSKKFPNFAVYYSESEKNPINYL